MPDINHLLKSHHLKSAYQWCCQKRQNYHANANIWHLRRNWSTIHPQIIHHLQAGTYTIEPVKRIEKANGNTTWLWHPRDAIVLKAIALLLHQHLKPQLSKHCINMPQQGGIKRGIKYVHQHTKTHPFIFKSDVKSFYASIKHHLMLKVLGHYITCPKLLHLIALFLPYLEDVDANLIERKQGLSKSCPLSPILGALFLTEMDKALTQLPIKYIRFADDWIIMAKSRWHLRKAIRLCNQHLAQRNLKQHPDKTIILRLDNNTTKGFDFLGFRFNHQGLIDIREETKQRFIIKISQLYEQLRRIQQQRYFDINIKNNALRQIHDTINKAIKGYYSWAKAYCTI